MIDTTPKGTAGPARGDDEDIARARKILARLCDKGLVSMSIPVRESDEDLVLFRVIERAQAQEASGDAMDAKRYRWLREHRAVGILAHLRQYITAPWIDPEPTIDTAIDAAIKAEGQPK